MDTKIRGVIMWKNLKNFEKREKGDIILEASKVFLGFYEKESF